MSKFTPFITELSNNEALVTDFIFESYKKSKKINPQILEKCVLSYLERPGKKLRPAIVMLACQAFGGEKERALPLAAAVELFHTWTLVHDDIIDNDSLRRGVETVHVKAEKYAHQDLGLSPNVSEKYGKDVAILTGDIQHGWAISLISKYLPLQGVAPEVVLHLITELQIDMLRTLVEGEILDVDFGLFYSIKDLTDDQIIDMLYKKTGVFYEFCGKAGALIGQNSLEMTAEVEAITKFCSDCGTAFQVRDDILGLVGKENDLGKPVGSDIREGKKTIIVREALTNASESEREYLLSVLGNQKAEKDQIITATKLIYDLGGIDKAHAIATKKIKSAIPYLDIIADSREKDLLLMWADYMIERSF